MDIEGLGVFYLGSGPLLYPSADLTTHGVCVGMTGSGKTGLCLSLIEEAAIDGIPVIAIDPKGDLANLLLDPRATPDAKQWEDGLRATLQTPERIERLRAAVEMIVYTPGSDAGTPLALLRSLEAPSAPLAPEALRERIQSTTAALFGLAGVETSGPTARENVLVQSLLGDAWAAGRSLDLAALITAVQTPPFRTIGVMDVEAFFPAKERFELAMALNALLASPTAAQWLSGEPIDTDKLLYGPGGKPRVSIISIAHLSDQERMAVVTVLLGNVIAWMRGQTGTQSLRAMLFMDECAGFLPPVAAPPSKPLFLTLFKQARAFGLGVVVASQNPVDVDYKVLSNAGTWFVGRLQTERDRERVLSGMVGAAEQRGGTLVRAEYERLIAGLEKRQFVLYTARGEKPRTFVTRQTLSHLRGPMSLVELKELRRPSSPSPSTSLRSVDPSPARGEGRAVLEPGITQLFVPPVGEAGELRLRPAIVAAVRMRYGKHDVDVTRVFAAPVSDGIVALDWTHAETLATEPNDLATKAPAGAAFEPLPTPAARAQSYAAWRRSLVDWVAATQRLEFLSAGELTSKPGESERDFSVRLQLSMREARDAAVAALEKKYATKLEAAQERVRKARQAAEKKEHTASARQTDAMLNLGSSMLGMLMGKASVSRVATAAKSAQKLAAGEKDVAHAAENVRVAEEKLAALTDELARATQAISEAYALENVKIVKSFAAAKKTEVELLAFGLGWLPFRVTAQGGELAVYATLDRGQRSG